MTRSHSVRNRGGGAGGSRKWWDGAERDEPELRREMFREVKLAGMVPVPVAAMTAGSACCNNHSIVSPSVLCPSSRVSWKTLAAQRAGMRMRRPRPSTLVWRSLVEVLLGGGFLCSCRGLLPVSVGVMAVEEEGEGAGETSFFSRSCKGKFGRRGAPPVPPVGSPISRVETFVGFYTMSRGECGVGVISV